MSWLQGRRREPAALQGVGRFIDGLTDPDPRVRTRSLRRCGRARVEAVVPLLRDRLLDPDCGVRGAAAGALGRTAAIPLLVRALSDQRPKIRQAAGRALVRLGERAAVEEAMGDVFRKRPAAPRGRRRGLFGWRWGR